MRKHHVLGMIIILSGVLMANHWLLIHEPKGQYPPELIFAFVIPLIIGFGVLTDLMRIKNV